MATLVLVRHGQSIWNLENKFTGWHDVDLTEKGEAEARAAGPMLTDAGLLPDVVHTSLQLRAIRTAELTLAEMGRSWIPVRRSWRLNERHYGALQGLNKAETKERHGAEQLHLWRRGYTTPPPPVALDSPHHPLNDPRYADVAPELLPACECLADVLERMLPYWFDGIVPDLRLGRTVLVSAHGNSLRALVKHLDEISDEAIPELNIPTGQPLIYELGDDMRPAEVVPTHERYLDPEAAAAEAAKVAAQAG